MIKTRELAAMAIAVAEKTPRVTQNVPAGPEDYWNAVVRESPSLFTLTHGLNERQLSELVLQLHWGAQWHRDGMPVFQPTKDLVAALALTDASRVQIEEVHPPFDSLAVVLPPGFWALSHQGTHQIWTDLVIDPNESSDICTMLVHRYRDPSKNRREAVAILALAESGILLWDNTHLPDEGQTLDEWLALGKFTDPDYKYRDTEVNEDEKAIQRQLRRLWVNLCFYIEENGRGKRVGRLTPKKRKGNRSKPKRVKPKVTTWILGQEIKLGPGMVEAARKCHTAAGWKVSVRSVVRGHQKMQAHGPRHSLRKRIWVKPYPRGPQDGPRVSHLYTTETDDG